MRNASDQIQIVKAVTDDALGIQHVLYTTWLATYPNEKYGITLDDIMFRHSGFFYKKLGFVDNGKRFTEERFRMKSGSIIPEMEMVFRSRG